MKLYRLGKTLLYFDVIPFVNYLKTLFRKEDKYIQNTINNMDIILFTDTETNLATAIIDSLLEKNYQVRGLSRDSSKAREKLGDKVEIITADITVPATLNPQIWEGVNSVICFNQPGINNLIQLAAKHLKQGEKFLFDFTKPSAALKETWGAVDDVVMGGISESNIKLAGKKAIFSGVVSTANNGGFASVRTINFNPPGDLSAYEGIKLRIQGDGKRYKFIIRCEGKWDGIGYCYSFDTLHNCWTTITIPFAELIPVFRAKTVTNAGNFNSSKVYSMQLMLSKFEYDGEYNPKFQPGSFALEIESIKAYGGKSIPQLVLVGNKEMEAIASNSGLNYAIVNLENGHENERVIVETCTQVINNPLACN